MGHLNCYVYYGVPYSVAKKLNFQFLWILNPVIILSYDGPKMGIVANGQSTSVVNKSNEPHRGSLYMQMS